VTLSKAAVSSIKRHSLTATPQLCLHDHKLQDSGAVFYQSIGVLECVICGGYQEIRKPIK
jgi:hypothetical protein